MVFWHNMLLLLPLMTYFTVILLIVRVILYMLVQHMIYVLRILFEAWTIIANSTSNFFYFMPRTTLEQALKILDVLFLTTITKTWISHIGRNIIWNRWLKQNILNIILLKWVNVVDWLFFVLNNVFVCVALHLRDLSDGWWQDVYIL